MLAASRAVTAHSLWVSAPMGPRRTGCQERPFRTGRPRGLRDPALTRPQALSGGPGAGLVSVAGVPGLAQPGWGNWLPGAGKAEGAQPTAQPRGILGPRTVFQATTASPPNVYVHERLPRRPGTVLNWGASPSFPEHTEGLCRDLCVTTHLRSPQGPSVPPRRMGPRSWHGDLYRCPLRCGSRQPHDWAFWPLSYSSELLHSAPDPMVAASTPASRKAISSAQGCF